METKNYTGIVPDQQTGKEIIAEKSTVTKNEEDAIAFYNNARQKLLNVNNWRHVAGWGSASFHAMDATGKKLERNVQQGDFMRIDIPGPGPAEGDGYDWVKVEAIEEVNNENIESVGFTVRPAANPQGDDDKIAHFYNEDSTSSFIVTREKTKITASIYDRNIKPNDNSKSGKDFIRNLPVAKSAIAFFSKIQWQHLANGLVKEHD